jgi:tRNA(Leu) C34 or U34 (ribose-2'-O)-methylase TrmL
MEVQIQNALAFRYSHIPATLAPSKQTATGRKGRSKDEEAAQDTRARQTYRSWRKPAFVEETRGGKDYGSAIHGAMQYIRYEACSDEEGVRQEILDCADQELIIPMNAHCESLNAAVAATIVMWQMRQ